MLFCGRCTGVDRTGTISNRFKYRVLTSIPKIPPIFTKSFKDICFERAQEIVDLNKPISIMWSGGIDSTGVLTTLMQIALPKQITVLFEPRSLIEYPWFFENHIKGKLKYKILDQHIWRYERNPNEILVTPSLLYHRLAVIFLLEMNCWNDSLRNQSLIAVPLLLPWMNLTPGKESEYASLNSSLILSLA